MFLFGFEKIPQAKCYKIFGGKMGRTVRKLGKELRLTNPNYHAVHSYPFFCDGWVDINESIVVIN